MKIMLESYAVLEPGDLTGKEMFKFGQLASDFFAPYEGNLSHGATFECLPNLRRGIANVFYEYVRTQPTKELFREFLYFFIILAKKTPSSRSVKDVAQRVGGR
ncbi:hypothetical protein [Bacillus cereus]|uniref:hypothetical protein n=1 Tax=Bacillus cereus TaxID=1396 RepID=UPI000C0353E6|nr:hypothetical protein [Bacillus cereus]PGW17355.1 hypothetical protein COD88_31360 [Bacillus cereus]